MRSHLPIAAFLITALSATRLAPAQDAESLTITHLANEGFLISDDSGKVLIDALLGSGIPPYRTLTDEQRKKLEQGTPPFDGIGLVLATHHHADHFDASTTADFLKANPEVRFMSTPQAVEKLHAAFGSDESASDRIRSSLPKEGERETFTHDGITIQTLNLHHGRQRSPVVENIGFLIEMGNMKILHVGDTVATAEEIAINRLAEEHIDITLLPYWMLTGERWKRVITESIAAKTIIVMHIPGPDAPPSYFQPATDIESLRKLILQRHPNARIPDSGKSFRVAPGSPDSVDEE